MGQDLFIYQLQFNCLLYFGIREQKQILIIENRFIVSQNIPHYDLYTLLHAFEPIPSTFATLI